MSSKQTLGAQDEPREVEGDMAEQDDRGDGNNVAQKLSNELDTWRRQRSGTKPQRPVINTSSNGQSTGPGRTIKVRGHETLVVRKHKIPPKPESESAADKN